MDRQRSKNCHHILKKRNEGGELTLSDVKTIKYWHKKKKKKQNKITIPEKYLHLSITKVKISDAAVQWGQEFIFSINGLGSIGDPFDKKEILTPPFLTHKEIQND